MHVQTHLIIIILQASYICNCKLQLQTLSKALCCPRQEMLWNIKECVST